MANNSVITRSTARFDKAQQKVKSRAPDLDHRFTVLFWIGVVIVLWAGGVIG